ncbi:Methyltransferase domain [Geosmithia morbida]|uniref:Methyltransferase domain n=1 Tax=Geosmithia morbida TaxID=1094350 RepID=A0A9P4YVA9_9HYPO|nr:Methyltransferase domain [Geosmithia morbida]KAF4122467.1 Methyltransferase domain [Geosmithia morbida]
MADTFCPPQALSSLVRGQQHTLNPIIEEDCEDGRTNDHHKGPTMRANHNLKIQAWLSPMSDHFPTPRGINYLSAPILPSSPSSSSADHSSPTNSSNPWNRMSCATDRTDFEDLYDATDDDECDVHRHSHQRVSHHHKTSSSSSVTKLPSIQRGSSTVYDHRDGAPLNSPTRLIIPDDRQPTEEHKATMNEFKKIVASPVPLTPSAQLPMSPAQLKFMDKQQAQHVPTDSAPPSLDGSLSSEQLAAMSAPPTPVMDNDDDSQPDENWSGVQLQPGALETLQSLSFSGDDEANQHAHEHPDRVLEIPRQEPWHEHPQEMREQQRQQKNPVLDQGRRPPCEMQQQPQQQPLRLITSLRPASTWDFGMSTDPSRKSLAGLTKLDIPSPGGFFSELSPRTRSTWHIGTKTPDAMVPPTSTTAEQFYRCPWNTDTSLSIPPVPQRPDSAEGFYRDAMIASPSQIVEQMVEVIPDDVLSDDMPTAKPVLQHQNSDESGATIKPPKSPGCDSPTEIVLDYDPKYARKQQETALSNLGRTELWLLAQRAYLKDFDQDKKAGKEEDKEDGELTTIIEAPEAESPRKLPATAAEASQPETKAEVTPPRKKSVRFSEMNSVVSKPKSLPSKLLRQESAYYRAFLNYVVKAHRQDVFVHQLVRFEALQGQRISLRDAHRNQLLGKYQLSVVPQSAKKRLSTNVVRGDDSLTDDLDKIRREKEFEAACQMAMPTWHVAAMRFLNGGRLITAPVTKRLARMSLPKAGSGGASRERPRILDLGGQSTCDWAWHCALQYPNAKVYTVTTKTIRQLSNANIRGPANHRQVAVERLSRLPFRDNHFDLVYARELHSILKFVGENGEDEWETCLRECMRVLKPGGYLEFSLLDSELMNAGPMGLAKSVEFAFTLKTLGYDPSPSKLWLNRLARAGFQDTRRMWMCLPVGAKRAGMNPPLSSSTSFPGTTGKAAPTMGSTDNIANVCGIVGGWNWERWLLRCEMEKVAGEMRLVDTVTAGAAMHEAGKCLESVASVMEEGRNCRSAFRMLNGYTRKPLE